MKRKAITLFKTNELFDSPGGAVIVKMKVLEVEDADEEQQLFLGRFNISLIAFRALDPNQRVLVDCHKPFGLHSHIDLGPRQEFEANSVGEVVEIFNDLVRKRFLLD